MLFFIPRRAPKCWILRDRAPSVTFRHVTSAQSVTCILHNFLHCFMHDFRFCICKVQWPCIIRLSDPVQPPRASLAFIPSTFHLRLINCFGQPFAIICSMCSNHLKILRSTLSLSFTLTPTLYLVSSFIHLFILVTGHILRNHLISITSLTHPHAPSFRSICHRWYCHSFLQLPHHTQTYTLDIKHHLHYTEGIG